MKNFDEWGTLKKNINDNYKNKWTSERDVWWCNLGLNIGFEQNGDGVEYSRPVLILKVFNKDVSLIVPLTTSQKANKYHFDLGIIDNKKSFVILSQIKLIDTKRLEEKICKIDKDRFLEIKNSIQKFFK
jgi:mRNA interferase MazF